MKTKIIIPLLLIIIAMPHVVSAAWWNPFTWSFFNRESINVHTVEPARVSTTSEPIIKEPAPKSEVVKNGQEAIAYIKSSLNDIETRAKAISSQGVKGSDVLKDPIVLGIIDLIKSKTDSEVLLRSDSTDWYASVPIRTETKGNGVIQWYWCVDSRGTATESKMPSNKTCNYGRAVKCISPGTPCFPEL